MQLVSVLHDAEEAGVKDELFMQIVEHMIGYIEGNKQAIKYSLDKMGIEGEVFNSKRFNLAKFLATLVLKEGGTTDSLRIETKYFIPLAQFINRLII